MLTQEHAQLDRLKEALAVRTRLMAARTKHYEDLGLPVPENIAESQEDILLLTVVISLLEDKINGR